MEEKLFRALDPVILSPLLTGPVGTGNKKAMQYREKDRPFHIKSKLSVREPFPEDLAKPQFFPDPMEDERRSDPGSRRLGIAPGGQNKQGLFGEPGQGPHQGFDLSLSPEFRHRTEMGDDPLAGLVSLSAVFHDLEVFIGT